MTAETHRKTSEYLQDDGDLFLGRLEEVRGNPHETLITMQTALGIDLGRKVGFYPDKVRDNPDAVRAMQLSLRQYEAIMSLGELVSIYIEHGAFTPHELGVWFDTYEGASERKPIDVLFVGFSEEGFHWGSLSEVSEHASSLLEDSGHKAIRKRWGN